MVRYTGRQKTITGAVNRNQVGLKMSGCPSRVGRSGKNLRLLGRRVNCMYGLCGPTMVNGAPWRTTGRNDPPYCRQRSTSCAQAAGGVGHINSPYTRTRVPTAGQQGCTEIIVGGGNTPWWYNNSAVLAAYNLLTNYFKNLDGGIFVLVGISETLADDLGQGTPVSDTMKHYARGDDTLHAADNYNGLPSQELKNAVDLLNSMHIHAAVPSNILGGAKGPMPVQRHIVGTVHQAGLVALTQPLDPDDKIGYEMPLSSTRNIWVLGGVGDITGGSFAPNDGYEFTSAYWHLTFDFTGYTSVPSGFSGVQPSSDPSPGRFFQIWYKINKTQKATPCSCTGGLVFGACVDPFPPTVCTSVSFWVKFFTAEKVPHWIQVFFDNGSLCGACGTKPSTSLAGAAHVKIHSPNNTDWDNNGDLHKILKDMFFALDAQGSTCNPFCDGGRGPFAPPYFELLW